GRDVEHLGGGALVDVGAFAESLQEGGSLGKMGQDAQRYLRVVGRDDPEARIGGEWLTGAPAHLGADGNVLQVGFAGGQPPGGGDRLVEGGVQPPGARVDQGGKRL